MPDSGSEKLILIVVGAHIRAELHDRAIAAEVRSAVAGAVRTRWTSAGLHDDPPTVVILSDLWRLNDPHLAPLPQVAIGHPELNAVTAFFADKIPPAFVVDGEFAVQFDAAAPEAVAACWGTTHAGTARAAAVFIERYLDRFADAAIRELAE